MLNKTEALAEKVEALRAEIVELDAIEAPTEEQAKRFDAAIVEFDAAKAELDAANERAAKVEAVKAAEVAGTARVERAFHAPNVVVKRDAFEDVTPEFVRLAPATEVVSRALSGVEQTKARGLEDSAKERAATLAEMHPDVARQILLTGTDAYRSGFEKLMRMGEVRGLAACTDAERAALSNTGANGGFSNPWLLDPTIILTNDGSSNPFRQIANIVTGTTDKWNGITSAGVTAEWLAEGSQAADASPTVAQPSITAFKASAYIFASYEQEADGQLVSQLPTLIADAKDRLEATAFATGNGTTAPEGVVTGVGAVTASRVSPQTGGSFTVASIQDVFTVANALTPRSTPNSAWLGNKTTLNLIRRMAMAQNSANSVWTDFELGRPGSLLGAPAYESSAMTSTYTTGSDVLLAGDFKAGYYIFDRLGVEMRYLPIVVGANQRPTGQAGWFAFWRVGAKVVDPNEFRLLRL